MNSQTTKATRLTYYATQVELGWLALERVPARYRSDVARLIDAKKAAEEAPASDTEGEV